MLFRAFRGLSFALVRYGAEAGSVEVWELRSRPNPRASPFAFAGRQLSVHCLLEPLEGLKEPRKIPTVIVHLMDDISVSTECCIGCQSLTFPCLQTVSQTETSPLAQLHRR